MSVLDVNDTVLSNAEALEVIKFNKEFLDSCTDRRAGYDVSLKEAKWVHKKATTFLNTTPAGSQTRDAARQLLEVLDHEDNAYGFTDFEKLQILNLRPHNAVALHTVVEDCAERLTEAQVEEVCNYIQQILPEPLVKDAVDDDFDHPDGAAEAVAVPMEAAPPADDFVDETIRGEVDDLADQDAGDD